MKRALSFTTLSALVLAFLSRSVAAQDSTAGMSVAEFVQKVAEDNWMEIQISNMAVSEAKSDQARTYATQRQADHMVNLDTIEKYAKKNGIALSFDKSDYWTPPAPQSDKDRGRWGTTERNPVPVVGNAIPGALAPAAPSALAFADNNHWRHLSGLHGGDFDRAYVGMMVDDQQKTITMLENQLKAKIGDYELRYYMSSTLRVLRQRLSVAQALLGTP